MPFAIAIIPSTYYFGVACLGAERPGRRHLDQIPNTTRYWVLPSILLRLCLKIKILETKLDTFLFSLLSKLQFQQQQQRQVGIL